MLRYKMDSAGINRALISGGLWMGVVYGVSLATGMDAPLSEIATDAALMAASALGADVAVKMTGFASSPLSSAVATGAIFAAAQAGYRGDDSYLVNFLSAAGNDFLTETVLVRVLGV